MPKVVKAYARCSKRSRSFGKKKQKQWNNDSLPTPGTSHMADHDDDYNFQCLQATDCDEIEMEELATEHELPSNTVLQGNRVVDLNYLLSESLHMYQKHSMLCTAGHLEMQSEKRLGLVSTIFFKCNICDRTYNISTFPNETNINKLLVWGTLSTGSTYTHSEELLSVMDIPTPCSKVFYKYEAELGNVWKTSLWENMCDAGKEEKDIAISQGNIDEEGTPYITVYLDGGWSKRSYGHNYNANSGVAVIIGKATSKVLYIGVRNKYCTICARSESLSVEAKTHVCFKNWTASSSAMEADIIVQGFNLSNEMHGVKFRTFIADGDSSVYVKIQRDVTYGHEVSKIECVNHVLKNYSKKLFMIKNDTKNIPICARKLLTQQIIKKLVDRTQHAIYQNSHGHPNSLEDDFLNSINHVFGNHTACMPHYCDKIGDATENNMPLVKTSGLYPYVFGALENLMKKKDMLIDNETNNRAETFMSILCRFNMGKRLNLIGRGSFERRAYLAALRYNEGFKWHEKPYENAMKASPGHYLKKFVLAKSKEKATKSTFKSTRKEKSEYNSKKNIDYGPLAEEPILDNNTFEEHCLRKINSMKVTKEEIEHIAKNTIGQFNNQLYISHRTHRLTASMFGRICKKRDQTPCHNYVKQVLYPSSLRTHAIEYGIINESVARCIFQQKFNQIVTECGIFIHPTLFFLGATPDGLIGDNAIIEIKCLYKLSDKMIGASSLEDFLKSSDYLVNNDGNISLKRNHNYYYQVQGQLECTGRKWCYFVVFVNQDVDIFVEKIERDEEFWKQKMEEKLIKFYRFCILPEIILKQVPRNLKCTDKYFLEDNTKMKQTT